MAHLPTKYLSSNPARRSVRPSLCQVTLRGGTADQVSTKQPYEAERSTKSLSSNHARRSGRSILARVTQRGGGLDLVLLTHVSHDKTRHHQTTSEPRVWHIEGASRGPYKHDGTPLRMVSSVSRLPCGVSQSRHGGPKHQSLHSNPHTRKDMTIHHTGCTPTHNGR
jgi:hypothetical protein